MGTEDSGLAICGMEGEAAVFGGALRLDGLEWEPWEERPGVWTARTGVFRRIDGLFADGKRQTLCRFPNETPGAYPLGGAATAEEIKERAKGYQNPAGGFLRALHEYAWGGNDYVILGKDANSETGLACRWVGDNNRGDRLKPDAVVVENGWRSWTVRRMVSRSPDGTAVFLASAGDAALESRAFRSGAERADQNCGRECRASGGKYPHKGEWLCLYQADHV